MNGTTLMGLRRNFCSAAATPTRMVNPDLIRALPLFKDLSPAAAAALAAGAVERRYAAGRLLYATGSKPAGLLVVLEGTVRVLRGRGGRQHLVHEEGPGGALGEVPVFAGGSYPATAVAGTPVRCILLSTDAISTAVRLDPALAFLFLRRLASRVRHLVDRVDRLAAQSVNARLARLLLERQQAAGEGTAFSLARTQTEVAEELGTVREVVVRALRQLCQSGAIEAMGRARYRVRDRAGLRRLADQ